MTGPDSTTADSGQGPRRSALTKRVFWESPKEEFNTVTPLTLSVLPVVPSESWVTTLCTSKP